MREISLRSCPLQHIQAGIQVDLVADQVETVFSVAGHDVLGVAAADHQVAANHHDDVVQVLVAGLEELDLTTPALRLTIEGGDHQHLGARFDHGVEELLQVRIYTEVVDLVAPGLQGQVD